MADNPTISHITLPSGTTYDIKDAYARQAISDLGNYSYYIGVTTTALTDGSTTNPIQVNGEAVTATTGGICTYDNKEFIWNGSAWQEFGDFGALGAMAYADTASTSYTPSGSVSLTNSNVTATVTPASSGDATYTPAGSISGASFTGSSTTSTGKFTPSGSVSLTNSNTTATVAPAATGDATYTPAGSVGAPTISVASAGATSSAATGIAAAAPGQTAPSNAVTYYNVANETLSLYQIGYNTDTFKTGDASYEASAPSFTGTGVRLVTGNISVPSSASFTGTEDDVSVTGTPQGSVSGGTFSGTGVRLVTGNISVPSSASFSGTAATVQVTPDSST